MSPPSRQAPGTVTSPTISRLSDSTGDNPFRGRDGINFPCPIHQFGGNRRHRQRAPLLCTPVDYLRLQPTNVPPPLKQRERLFPPRLRHQFKNIQRQRLTFAPPIQFFSAGIPGQNLASGHAPAVRPACRAPPRPDVKTACAFFIAEISVRLIIAPSLTFSNVR